MVRALPVYLVGLLLLGGAARPASTQEPEETFSEEITVSLSTLVVRAVDTWGRPILNLGPEDFRVEVKGEEIPVLAADWIGSDGPAQTGPSERAEAEDVGDEAAPRGRLAVLFVQADLNPTRISGQMRLRTHVRELLGTLPADDWIAVVSYDSHLKLRLDFTRDREAASAAVDRAVLYGDEPEIEPAGPPALARHFDRELARSAASPERALELTAKALGAFPGEKTMIFLGWGLGRFGSMGVQTTPAFRPAVRALRQARVAVFVLDVTSADSHSLEIGLEAAAEATGGLYLKTFRLPELATRILAETMSGHYVLTLDDSRLPEGSQGKLVEVGLRDRRRGSVLTRTTTVPQGR